MECGPSVCAGASTELGLADLTAPAESASSGPPRSSTYRPAPAPAAANPAIASRRLRPWRSESLIAADRPASTEDRHKFWRSPRIGVERQPTDRGVLTPRLMGKNSDANPFTRERGSVDAARYLHRPAPPAGRAGLPK